MEAAACRGPACHRLITTTRTCGTTHRGCPHRRRFRDRKVLRYEVDLGLSVELKTALSTTDYHGYPVVALRFENPEVVGEYAIEGTQSPEEFLHQFNDTYGTRPMIVAAVVEVPESELEALDAAIRQDAEDSLKARGSAPSPFVAPPADQKKVAALSASQQTDDSSSVQAADSFVGAPEYGEFEIYRPSTNTVRFTQFYTWGPGERPTHVNSSYGLEFEINIRTDSGPYQTGLRPACTANYKIRPFAANENWNWSALVNAGTGLKPVASAVGAYADYNDALNECATNSMAIGLRTPQALPANPSGITELLITIDAPKGMDTTGTVSGVVQTLNESWCVDFPLLSNTDCRASPRDQWEYVPCLQQGALGRWHPPCAGSQRTTAAPPL